MRDWNEFDRFCNLMMSKPWVYAKTMPHNPHHYSLRAKWGNDATFMWAVEYLRANGYPAIYGGYPYIQIDINEHFYWTMNNETLDEVTLINRKVRKYPTPYDTIAVDYDGIFSDEASAAEDREVMDMLGDVSGMSVLDVGCGTGLLLRHKFPLYYTGIDPSTKMVEQALALSPNITCTRLWSFYTEARFDLVVALFGSAAYLNADEIARMSMLLRPGGRAFAMFYADDYEPITHRHAPMPPAPNLHNLAPGEGKRWHNFIIKEWAV